MIFLSDQMIVQRDLEKFAKGWNDLRFVDLWLLYLQIQGMNLKFS